MKGLTDIPGIRVGHASDYDALTGCTVILCDGAVGGVDIRGFATGTQEIDVLSPTHVAPYVHGIVLSGGSAFGLEAAAGVRRFLERKGIGFNTRFARVPIVPSAILYDLGVGKADVRPTREMGEAAAAAATDSPVQEGCVGAGTGATIGKVMHPMKSGIGSYAVTLPSGTVVAALAAVNAVGDVRDPATGKIVAGTRRAAGSMEFADSEQQLLRGASAGFDRSNTTLAVVATDAQLTKAEAGALAHMAFAGMARTIRPVNLTSDGDVVFGLSLGKKRENMNTLGVAAAEALAQAILRSVKNAVTLGGVPGLAGSPK